jgi:hypothetical protein
VEVRTGHREHLALRRWPHEVAVDTADIEACATTSLREGLAETLTVGSLGVTCIVIDDGRLGK